MAPRSTNPVFETVTVSVNDTDYVLRELSAGEYDECLSVATNPETGDVDMVLMVKLMLIKSIEKPALSDTELMNLPYRISRSLKRAVSRLHWSDDQEEVAKEAEVAADEEGAGPNP